MSAAQPIKSYKDVQRFKEHFLQRGEYRNYLLVSICLNTALRIRDVLALKWSDITYSPSNRIRTHITLKEHKTGKITVIRINSAIRKAVRLYLKNSQIKSEYIFAGRNNSPITRADAFYIVRDAGAAIGLEHRISPHSLRKTFGYHAAQNGTPPAVLMQIYNHSSYEITKRYLGISQEEKDRVFMETAL